jgi:hypothetical protein
MRTFIIQLGVFALLFFSLAYGVFCLADGDSDFYYARFTTPVQSSLVLGTSKSAMGIQPSIVNKTLDRKDIYNYSFTLAHSSFGPAYFKSIKKKLDPETKNGIFIITVDPFSVAAKLENLNDSLNFRETNRFISINNVTTSPNLSYLLHHYPHQYIYILTHKLKYVNNEHLHDDGWVEVNLDMDENSVKERTKSKIEEYVKNRHQFGFSEVRFSYLEKTIQFLQQHGQVFLVRLPVLQPLWEVEDSVVPDFDLKLKGLGDKHNVNILSFKDETELYEYTDGYHLYKTSGTIVSEKIGEWIKSRRNIGK